LPALSKIQHSGEDTLPKKIIVAISGANGVIYGVRLLQLLKKTDVETHLIVSEVGKLNLKFETDL
jgi:4-hydroxy-3-polyprenylbenzoate decarboxylase